MINLLSANFSRLKKSKIFWIGIAAMFVIGLLITINHYNMSLIFGDVAKYTIDKIFFGYTLFIGAFYTIFCSLFIGTEYSDGTIRNKIIIGHSRSTLYLSNLIVSIAAGLLMSLAFIAVVSAIGIPLFGSFNADIKTVLLLIFDSIMLIVAFASIFTLISMSNQNKAIVVVICIIVFVLLFFFTIQIYAKLVGTEYYTSYELVNGIMTNKEVRNPDYLSGPARDVYTFFYDFLPTGQAHQFYNDFALHQFYNDSATHLWKMPLYSLLITIAATLGGILYFRKKDLK